MVLRVHEAVIGFHSDGMHRHNDLIAEFALTLERLCTEQLTTYTGKDIRVVTCLLYHSRRYLRSQERQTMPVDELYALAESIKTAYVHFRQDE
ncbi:hypothetical protein KY362_00320 [Candidatus Woesearchaeota archaeon]|nr:hypothetical protein [Candidatus Woesearchaeota archaeon]